jgi:hypothetical protein
VHHTFPWINDGTKVAWAVAHVTTGGEESTFTAIGCCGLLAPVSTRLPTTVTASPWPIQLQEQAAPSHPSPSNAGAERRSRYHCQITTVSDEIVA